MQNQKINIPNNNREVDYLVIGSGAAGSAFAWRLSSRGFNVTCLDQGGFINPSSYPTTDKNWEVLGLTDWNWDPNLRNNKADYPVNNQESPIDPLMFNAVGGSTIHWTAHTPRFHPSDFKVKSLDGKGDDWPITYYDLEKYYDLNDEMMGCAGINGDPANPERSERPMPPLPLGEDGEMMARAFDKLGWHWWPSDSYVNSVNYKGRKKCNYCGPNGFGCTRSSKSSTDFTYWPEAIKYGAKIITYARVKKILTDEKRRGIGAEYIKNGKVHTIRANNIIVACNGIGTPRLLLMSATKNHENGLGNSSGLVGKNLMFHPYALVKGYFEGDHKFYKGPLANILMSQQFYETDKSRRFIRGYSLQMVRSTGPISTALSDTEWGSNHHKMFQQSFGKTLGFSIIAEDLPEEINQVVLDKKLHDSSNLPCPKIIYKLSENSEKILSHAINTTSQVLEAAGASKIVNDPLMKKAGWHLMGTTKMGEDPETSVTNAWGKLHDFENIFIIDGSLFVTSAAVNPTPTIQALALRTADYISNRK